MGRRGPKSKPLSLLRLSGGYRFDRHGGVPEPAPAVPRRPKWLSPNARRHWRELVPMLQRMGVLAAPYSITLGLLTEALANYIAYSEMASKTSLINKTPAGGYMHNPIYRARDDAWERVLKAAREFGLSPSAVRGVLKIPGANPHPSGLDAYR